MPNVDSHHQTLQEIFNTAITVRQHEITNLVYQSTRGIVQGGPFRGMRLLHKSSWGAGELSPKLLGCYEAELIPYIIEAVAKKILRVINVGCAEGYYAIGLARRIPHCSVIAYDMSPTAQAVCMANAKFNGLSQRIDVRGKCTTTSLSDDLADGTPTFMVMDCEGAEMLLLDPTLVPLDRCDILVECHDLFNAAITPTLFERFSGSHTIERIEESARNPNSPILRNQDSVNRWLAVCEFRMAPQHWLMFRSKANQ